MPAVRILSSRIGSPFETTSLSAELVADAAGLLQVRFPGVGIIEKHEPQAQRLSGKLSREPRKGIRSGDSAVGAAVQSNIP